MKIALGSQTMGTPGEFECDMVDATTGEKIHTISLASVPRVGEEIDVDSGGRDSGDDLYRVVRVRYHLRSRKFVRTGLVGISLYVERAN